MEGDALSDESVAGLRAVADRAIEEIGKAQSALGLARDRAQSAQDVLRIGLQGANCDNADGIRAALTQLDSEIHDAIGTATVTVEQVVAWTGTL